jgi:hypothetical protein
MPTVHFGGHIVPSAVKIDINNHPTISWYDDERDNKIEFVITIQQGLIDIRCTASKYDHDVDLVRFYMRGFDLVRGIVDLTCFNGIWPRRGD